MPPTHRHPSIFGRCFRQIRGASDLEMNPQHSPSLSFTPAIPPSAPTEGPDENDNVEPSSLLQAQVQNFRDGEHSDRTQPPNESVQILDNSAGMPNENSTEGGQNPGSMEAQTGSSDGPPHLGLTELQVESNEGIAIERIMDPVLQPYRMVKNLLWIKRNTVYSTALEEWDRTAKLLAERVDRMEKRSGDLKNEVYQLVGFFSVFQGVVLTAVTQMTQCTDMHTTCKKVWGPSLLTALAWAVTIYGVWQKLHRIQKLDDECFDEDEARREAVGRALDLRKQGKAFRFNLIKEKRKGHPAKQFLGIRRSFWIKRFGVVFATLSLFTGIFVASYFLILCDRGLAPILLHISPTSS